MFRNRFDVFARFNDDGVPQGGNPSDGDPESPSQSFQRLLERNNNDATQLASRLFDENYQARRRIRQLESENRDLQGRVPGEGTVVLTGDEAQAWQAYRGLGTPDEVKQGLDERTEYAERLQGMERETLLRQVAEQAGYKPSVLAQLERMAKAQGKDLAFELRDQDQEGQTVQVPFVKDGDAESPLTDYATSEWADFLPALSAQGAPPTPPAGVRYPPQHPGGTPRPKPKSVADAFLEEQEAKAKAVKNPLLSE